MSAAAALDLDAENRALEGATPQDILRWTWRQFRPDTILTCSFQHDGVVLAHMLQGIAPEVPVVFINTGFHFPETLAYRDEIVRRLGLQHFVELHPVVPRDEFARTHGLDLYARDPDLCCQINKVEPLRRHLPGVRACINGRRRDQAATRHDIPFSTEVVTPHVPWAAKLPGGPIRGFFVPPIGEGRDMVELMQRLSLDATTVTIDRNWDVNCWGIGDYYDGDHVLRGDRDDFRIVYGYVEEELTSAKPFEVLVIPGLNGWSRYTRKTRDAILRRVSEGAGLVLLHPFVGDVKGHPFVGD